MLESTDVATEQGHDAIQVFETFLEIGSVTLKDKMGVSQAAEDALYNFEGTSLSDPCHGKAAKELLSAMVNAEAYPGPFKSFMLTDRVPESWNEIMHYLVGADLVIQLSGDYWQLSEDACSSRRTVATEQGSCRHPGL